MIVGVATPSEPGIHTSQRIQPPPLATVVAAFPDLEILELVGVGGMGVVYKARQPRFDRFVALKLLPQSLSADPTFAERFDREARFLARLTHPNIVAVYDFGRAGGFCYLLMEFVDGLNLRQAMRAGRFTPEEALALVPRVCAALQYAHEQGVLHRDIKPENILLDSDGRVKIADFGIAKLIGSDPTDITLTRSGARLGTPHYMAPEQIEQPSLVDHRADIYSLGVVFYELLTGELPLGRFSAPSVKALIDARVDEIVMRALAKERELRQQTAGEVGSQVEGLGTPPPVTKATAKPTTDNGRWSGFRVVRAEKGRPVWNGSGIAWALAGWMSIVFLVCGASVVTFMPGKAPWWRFAVGFLLVSGWVWRGCERARQRFDPAAEPADEPVPIPRWAHHVGILLAIIAGLGVLQVAVNGVTRSTGLSEGVHRVSIPNTPLLILFPCALAALRRRWRTAATVLGSLMVGSTTAGSIRLLLWDAPAPGFDELTSLDLFVALVCTALFPVGLVTLWHPAVMRAFDAVDPRPAAPAGSARRPMRKTLFGWGAIGLGTVFALWAVISRMVSPIEYHARALFHAEPALESRLTAETFVGVAVEGGTVELQRSASALELWMLTARAGNSHDAAMRANQAFERLSASLGSGLNLTDRAFPADRPTRSYKATVVVAGGGLLLLAFPGLLLLRSRRFVEDGPDGIEAVRRWQHRRLVEAACAFVAVICGAVIFRIAENRDQALIKATRNAAAQGGATVEAETARLMMPHPRHALWFSATLWSNGVALALPAADTQILPSQDSWGLTMSKSWTLKQGDEPGLWILSSESAGSATFRLPPGRSLHPGPDTFQPMLGPGEKAHYWLFEEPPKTPTLTGTLLGIQLTVEADEVAIPDAAERLRSAVAQLPRHDYPSALREVNVALGLAIISNAPPNRLGWRFGTNAFFLSKPVTPRMLALKAIVSALANDAEALQSALAAGESLWPKEGPVEVYQIWVGHFLPGAPEVTDVVSIDAHELRKTKSGEPPMVKVTRRPKSFGQPESTFQLRTGWWDAR